MLQILSKCEVLTWKARLDFVEIWLLYRHSDFTRNQILPNSNGPKVSFLTILEALIFYLSNFQQVLHKFQIYQKFKFQYL